MNLFEIGDIAIIHNPDDAIVRHVRENELVTIIKSDFRNRKNIYGQLYLVYFCVFEDGI